MNIENPLIDNNHNITNDIENNINDATKNLIEKKECMLCLSTINKEGNKIIHNGCKNCLNGNELIHEKCLIRLKKNNFHIENCYICKNPLEVIVEPVEIINSINNEIIIINQPKSIMMWLPCIYGFEIIFYPFIFKFLITIFWYLFFNKSPSYLLLIYSTNIDEGYIAIHFTIGLSLTFVRCLCKPIKYT